MDIATLAFLIGRILLGGYFVWNGFDHLRKLNALAGYAASKEVPFPKLAVAVAAILILLGGLGVLLGVYVFWSLMLLVVFMIPVTFMMHAFWKDTDEQARIANKIQFFKNLALLGAILMLFALPEPWALSLF